MKTFIFLFIIVMGFFSFIFFYNDYKVEQEESEAILKSLEEIEKAENLETLKEVTEYTSLVNEEPTEIPQEQVFDTIKNILTDASDRIYTQNITLSTKIDSFLYTQASKNQFKEGVSTAFNINLDEVEKLYTKNRLVWDWVNQFKE